MAERWERRGIVAGWAVMAGWLMTGCNAGAGLDGGNTDPPVILGSSVEPEGSERNGSFSQAEALSLPGLGTALSYNTLATESDIDVYDLGEAFQGDRITVSINADDVETLDPAAAIFDDQGLSLLINDDINYFSGDWNASLQLTVRRSTDHLYLAVGSSPKSLSYGNYALTLSRRNDPDFEPASDPQIFFLNFNGGDNIAIGPRSPVDVPEFDAGTIASHLSDDTDAIRDRVVEIVRSDFAGMNILVFDNLDDVPDGKAYSTVYFGTYDPALLGVAENVDEYNERPAQPAIVFVDTFAAFEVLEPDVEQISQALANVASHEMGHLLGLNHTHDIDDLMDVTASLRQLMDDQSFGTAPIDPAVFPIGDQDSIALIIDAVGGDAASARAASKAQREERTTRELVNGSDLPRAHLIFGSGCLFHPHSGR